MTSHENFTATSESTFRILGIAPFGGTARSNLLSVPLFHVAGCNGQLIPTLELGGRVELLSNPLDFDGFFEAIGAHGVSDVIAVPAIYYALLRHPRFAELDVSGINWASWGGAPIAASLVREIEDAFPNARVGSGFGLTETSALASFLPDADAAAHADAAGFAVPVVDLAIQDAHPESGVGELLVVDPTSSRVTGSSPRPPPRPSSTAGCTPATSPASTRRACSTSSIARRT